MDGIDLFIGVGAILLGCLTLVGHSRRVVNSKLYERLRERFGERRGRMIHRAGYGFFPIALGVAVIVKEIFGWSLL
jgi:hypothetical protein